MSPSHGPLVNVSGTETCKPWNRGSVAPQDGRDGDLSRKHSLYVAFFRVVKYSIGSKIFDLHLYYVRDMKLKKRSP